MSFDQKNSPLIPQAEIDLLGSNASQKNLTNNSVKDENQAIHGSAPFASKIEFDILRPTRTNETHNFHTITQENAQYLSDQSNFIPLIPNDDDFNKVETMPQEFETRQLDTVSESVNKSLEINQSPIENNIPQQAHNADPSKPIELQDQQSLLPTNNSY